MREIRLAEMFAEELFSRASRLVESEAYGQTLALMRQKEDLQKIFRNGKFVWRILHKRVKHMSATDQVNTVRSILKDAVNIVTHRLMASIDTMRTEMLLGEIYQIFRKKLDFLDDVSTMLLIIPEDFLREERVSLMGRPELEKRLLEKNEELEMTLSRLKDEQTRISTMSREELEKHVEERTAELMKALEQVKASRANLEEFTSLATHELRTPIGIVKGYATLLLEGNAGKLSDQQQHFIAQIKDAIERQLELVNAMLNASRLELGTLAIDPQPTVIADLISKVIEELVPQTEAKHLTVTKQYGEHLPSINADPNLVRAVIQNLLTNAVKYTPENGLVLVRVDQKDPDIVVEVRDTGYGIPQEQQAKIFGKLFRADNVRTKQIEGTGLGLYIVKSVLEQSGGKIWFESPPSGTSPENAETPGTAFYVSIPLTGMKKKEGLKGLS